MTQPPPTSTPQTDEEKVAVTRFLNDTLRQSLPLTPLQFGTVNITATVASLDEITKLRLFGAIKRFDAFTEDNDPHGEHDYGSVIVEGTKYIWKIDYYDLALQYGSEEPWNAKVTRRLMTIMEADEY